MSFSDLTIEDYTGKSIVVQGDTRKYKEDLKKLGGKYNGRLKNGPGWIFPKTSEMDLLTFIKEGKRLVTEAEACEGEARSKQRAQEWDNQQKVTQKPKTHIINQDDGFSVRNTVPTLTEYGSLITLVNKMSAKLDRIDKALEFLLSVDQKNDLEAIMIAPVKKSFIKSKTQQPSRSDIDIEISSEEDGEVAPRKRLMRA